MVVNILSSVIVLFAVIVATSIIAEPKTIVSVMGQSNATVLIFVCVTYLFGLSLMFVRCLIERVGGGKRE